MSKHAENDGHKITSRIMRAFDSGDLKYIDGKFYRLCRHCMEYLELDEFYSNQRYVMGINYTCKRCTATIRRIKSYGVAKLVTDNGMKEDSEGITFSVNENMKNIINSRLNEKDGETNRYSQEDDN